MCGVVALLAPLPLVQREALVQKMCEILAHRGPDGQGLWSAALGQETDAGITLGHRRLSILDPSPAAAQPMSSGPLCISYNGEFYNYLEKRSELEAAEPRRPWHSHSDTEVLLRLCQTSGVLGALSEVNGMFAFALWDKEQRCLWLARDRFGEKPLYYLLDEKRQLCIVASEIKAIVYAARQLELLLAVRRDVLACYLADADYEIGDATFFSSISRVLPGELVRIGGLPDGRLTSQRRRYYEVSPLVCPPLRGVAADERFAELLADSLRLRLRSDVPVGACLSGGLDSSSLICVAQKLLSADQASLRTFSAIHRPGDACDERVYIDAVVRKTGVTNDRIDPEGILSPESFVAFLQTHDEPVGGASVFAQHAVYRRVAAAGVRVALSGQGADECLGGYRGTLPALQAGLLRQGIFSGFTGLPAALRMLARTMVPEAAYRRWLRLRWRAAFRDNRYFRLSALDPCPPMSAAPPYLAAFLQRSLLHGYLYSLLCGSSLGTILRYEDRNSMAASVEARAPFLDHRVVEHCLGRLPQELATDSSSQPQTKALLRRTIGPLLPELVRERRDKVGFAVPESRWLLGPLRPLILEILESTEQARRQHGLLERAAMAKHYQEALTGRVRPLDSHALFKMLNVELWLKQHSLSL